MKKSLLVLCVSLFVGAFVSFGQGAVQQVIASAGTEFDGTSIKLAWTLGEMVSETDSSATSIITQGFHQTTLNVSSGTPTLPELTFSVNAFPNPTSDHVFLNVDNENFGNFQYVLLDMNGTVVGEQVLTSDTQEIDFQGLANGMYILEVLEKQTLVKSFKIIKE